ncbi:hypothetical protein SHLA_23c000190 [Shinella sp. DD12]|nr:hypothetical protein SHLA_23c000190 [Shinella sp. DD12]
MMNLAISAELDDAVEIVVPASGNVDNRCSVVCLCCEKTGQRMDDDGCGICDDCLGLPAHASDDLDALEFPTPIPHLTLTTRIR